MVLTAGRHRGRLADESRTGRQDFRHLRHVQRPAGRVHFLADALQRGRADAEAASDEEEEVDDAPSTGWPALDDLLNAVASCDRAAIYACLRLAAVKPGLGQKIMARLESDMEDYRQGNTVGLDVECDVLPAKGWLSFVDGVLADSQGMNRPQEPADPETSGRNLAIDKASGELRRVVGYLVGRTFDQKVAALAQNVLVDGDTESSLKRAELYQGDIGADLLTNGCRTIIVENLDRFARDLSVQLQLTTLLASRGLVLVNATTGQDVTAAMQADPMMRAMIQIQGVFAELDKRLTVAKLKKARQRIRRQTGRCEGQRPFGSGPGEAATLARMRELNDGRTAYAIAAKLNRQGLPSRTGKPWTATVVRRILSRT
jgi:site-specific DNA recombinase